MENSFKQRLFYFFPVLFAFCLPFGSIVLSSIIVIWTFVSFFNCKGSHVRSGLKNKLLLLCFAFFFLTLISALISDNAKDAAFSVEVKLAFILFPFLFFCFPWPLAILKRCIISFVSGCFFASLYLILRALVYAAEGHPEYLYYSLFSDFIHASYFAMYLVLAIIFVLLFYESWFKSQKSVIYSSYFFIIIFVATIFLCSSKLGIISFFVCIPITLIYKWKSLINLKRFLMGVSVVAGCFIILYTLFPESIERMNSLKTISSQTIDKTSSESTTVRILIWEQAVEIIKAHVAFGTGVGDANDALYKAYQDNGLTGAYNHSFNAHNQFLQTFIGLGLAGIFLLVLLTFGQAVKAFIQKNILLLLFSILIIMNFLVESMLQTSAGMLFFVFFLCLISHAKLEDFTDGSSMNPENYEIE